MRQRFIILITFCFLVITHTGFSQNDKVQADSLIAFAKKQLGTHYVYAQCDPKSGFDCSGFVYYVFKHFDIKVPRASLDYEKMGKVISKDSCRKGDIIVFTGTNAKNRKPGHVGIIVSNDVEGIFFIHSSSGKKSNGVIVTNFSTSESYKIRFIKTVRLESVKQ